MSRKWEVLFYPLFDEEMQRLDKKIRKQLVLEAGVLAEFGPALGRPQVDTLNASKHANMKELRFQVGKGVWRVVFAFDPRRRAILLVAGNKAGVKQKLFYKRLIKEADKRFDDWLAEL